VTEPPTTINDWLKAHKALLDAERALADLADRYAKGKVTKQELDEAHESLIALRALVEAVLQKALSRRSHG
jgi:hypothetical protein